MYYNDNQQQKLGYSEFCEVFMDNLSHLVTNQSHIDNCSDFYEEALYKFYELYVNSKTENYSVTQFIRIFEITLYSMFKYRPDTELPEDIINIA